MSKSHAVLPPSRPGNDSVTYKYKAAFTKIIKYKKLKPDLREVDIKVVHEHIKDYFPHLYRAYEEKNKGIKRNQIELPLDQWERVIDSFPEDPPRSPYFVTKTAAKYPLSSKDLELNKLFNQISILEEPFEDTHTVLKIRHYARVLQDQLIEIINSDEYNKLRKSDYKYWKTEVIKCQSKLLLLKKIDLNASAFLNDKGILFLNEVQSVAGDTSEIGK